MPLSSSITVLETLPTISVRRCGPSGRGSEAAAAGEHVGELFGGSEIPKDVLDKEHLLLLEQIPSYIFPAIEMEGPMR